MRDEADFIVRLGLTKQDKCTYEFSIIHDETAFQIMREVGTDAFALYFALNSYTRGKTGVMAYPKNETLSGKLKVSERTIRRWKQQLDQAGIIRVVNCFLPSGAQTANVILLNASYPKIPEGWESYAQDGFTLSPGHAPVLRGEKGQEAKHRRRVKNVRGPEMTWTKVTGDHHKGGQNAHHEGDGAVTNDLGPRTDVAISLGGTSLVVARDRSPFFERELNAVEPNKKEEETALESAEFRQWVQQIGQVALPLLGRQEFGADEFKLLADLRASEISVETVRKGVQDSFRLFSPKYAQDRIKRLTYCRDRILELHSQVMHRGTSLFGPSMATQQGRHKAHQVTYKTEQRPGIPAVQPGKYDKFFEAYARREELERENGEVSP